MAEGRQVMNGSGKFLILCDCSPVAERMTERSAIEEACRRSRFNGKDYAVTTERGYPVAYIVNGKRVPL